MSKHPHSESGARSLELLWAGREPATRGPKPAFVLADVVRAGIELADANGLAAVTMAAVAHSLGVTSMALYRYVPGKDELVDLMNDAALGPPPSPSGGTWRDAMARWARLSLAGFEKRPWRLETAQRRVPIGPNWIGWLDAGLRALSDSGLALGERVPAVMLVDGHVRATAQVSASNAATEQWGRDFAQVLGAAVADPRFPALAALVAGGGFAPGANPEGAFEFGLQRVFDGLEARARVLPNAVAP